MLRWVLVELAHFIVELINLVLTNLPSYRLSLANTAWAYLVARVNLFSRLQILDLSLHIRDLRFKSFVAEHRGTLTSGFYAEIVLEAIVDG